MAVPVVDAMDISEPDFIRMEMATSDGFLEGPARRLLDTTIIFAGDAEPALVSSIMLRCLPSLNRWLQWNINRRSFFYDAEGRMQLAMDDYGPDEVVAFRHLLRYLHFTGDGPLTKYLKEEVLSNGYILHLIVMANKWLHHELVERAQKVLVDFIIETFLCGTNDVSEALEALCFCDEIELSKGDLTGIVRAGTFGLRVLSAQALDRIDTSVLARLPSDVLLHLVAFSGDPIKSLRFAQAGLERIARIIAPRCLLDQANKWKRHRADVHLSNLYLKHASSTRTTEGNVGALAHALQDLWFSARTIALHRTRSEESFLPESLVTAATFDESRVLRLVRVAGGVFMAHERFIVDGVEYFLRLAQGGELSLEALNVAVRGNLPRRLDIFISLDVDPRLEENLDSPRLVLRLRKQTQLPRADCEVLVRCLVNQKALATLAEVAFVISVQGRVLQSTRPRSWPSINTNIVYFSRVWVVDGEH